MVKEYMDLAHSIIMNHSSWRWERCCANRGHTFEMKQSFATNASLIQTTQTRGKLFTWQMQGTSKLPSVMAHRSSFALRGIGTHAPHSTETTVPPHGVTVTSCPIRRTQPPVTEDAFGPDAMCLGLSCEGTRPVTPHCSTAVDAGLDFLLLSFVSSLRLLLNHSPSSCLPSFSTPLSDAISCNNSRSGRRRRRRRSSRSSKKAAA